MKTERGSRKGRKALNPETKPNMKKGGKRKTKLCIYNLILKITINTTRARARTHTYIYINELGSTGNGKMRLLVERATKKERKKKTEFLIRIPDGLRWT